MIAFLINELNIRGGTHKQFLKLLEYTASVTDDFFIITKAVDFNKTYPGFKVFENKIRIFQPQKHKPGKLRSILALIQDIKSLRRLVSDADCINVHDNGYELYFPAFKGKQAVWQVNDLPPCFHVGNCKDTKRTWKDHLYSFLILRNTNYISRITVNVSKNKERIKTVFRRKADVLYCGIEPIDIQRDIGQSLKNFECNKLNLLSSGVFFPYRNYETQIKVVSRLVEAGIDVHLNIIGSIDLDNDYSQKIRNLVIEQCLEDRITICGMVDESTFTRLHEESDMFIFVNIDQSWGLAIFEAMSCGLPVIVSESVGATEILSDGENAVFVNPIDANQISEEIQALMNDPNKYKVLCNSGKIFHHDYTWDKAYSQPMYSILTDDKND